MHFYTFHQAVGMIAIINSEKSGKQKQKTSLPLPFTGEKVATFSLIKPRQRPTVARLVPQQSAFHSRWPDPF